MKTPLTTKQQIELLINNKNVEFEQITEIEAEDYLIKYNYINVITPYKHNFHKGKDVDGNHIYNEKTCFKNYVDCFKTGKEEQEKLLCNILYFECVFSSVLSYYVLMTIKNKFSSNYINFFRSLECSEEVTNFEKNKFKSIIEKLDKWNDPYILMDRLTFGEKIYIYKNSSNDSNIKRNVWSKLSNLDAKLVLETDSAETFLIKIKIVNYIRNVLAHNNNIDIAIKYIYDERLKVQRERKFYTDKPFGIKDINNTINSLNNLEDKYA